MFIIASFTTGKYLWKIGRERALIFGMLLIVSVSFYLQGGWHFRTGLSDIRGI